MTYNLLLTTRTSGFSFGADQVFLRYLPSVYDPFRAGLHSQQRRRRGAKLHGERQSLHVNNDPARRKPLTSSCTAIVRNIEK